jgi:hypothetical protein
MSTPLVRAALVAAFLATATTTAIVPTAAIAASTNPVLLTLNVPVTLKNIDREFDLFTIDCQIQWSAPNKNPSFTNGTTTVQHLVNRGFSGNVAVYWTDANAVQYGSQAVCSTTFHSSTDSSKFYDPDAVFQNGSPAAAPLPGAPRTTRFTVKLP